MLIKINSNLILFTGTLEDPFGSLTLKQKLKYFHCKIMRYSCDRSSSYLNKAEKSSKRKIKDLLGGVKATPLSRHLIVQILHKTMPRKTI